MNNEDLKVAVSVTTCLLFVQALLGFRAFGLGGFRVGGVRVGGFRGLGLAGFIGFRF